MCTSVIPCFCVLCTTVGTKNLCVYLDVNLMEITNCLFQFRTSKFIALNLIQYHVKVNPNMFQKSNFKATLKYDQYPFY